MAELRRPIQQEWYLRGKPGGDKGTPLLDPLQPLPHGNTRWWKSPRMPHALFPSENFILILQTFNSSICLSVCLCVLLSLCLFAYVLKQGLATYLRKTLDSLGSCLRLNSVGRRDAHSHTLLCVQFELCSCLLGDAAYFCCFLRQGPVNCWCLKWTLMQPRLASSLLHSQGWLNF